MRTPSRVAKLNAKIILSINSSEYYPLRRYTRYKTQVNTQKRKNKRNLKRTPRSRKEQKTLNLDCSEENESRNRLSKIEMKSNEINREDESGPSNSTRRPVKCNATFSNAGTTILLKEVSQKKNNMEVQTVSDLNEDKMNSDNETNNTNLLSQATNSSPDTATVFGEDQDCKLSNEDDPEMINSPMVSPIENVQEENLSDETNEDNESDNRRLNPTISPSISSTHLETMMDRDRELPDDDNPEMINSPMVSPIENVQEENLSDETNEDDESDDRRRLFDKTISSSTNSSHLDTMMYENRELSDEDNPEMTYSLMVSPIENVQEENSSDETSEDNESDDRRRLFDKTISSSTNTSHLETMIDEDRELSNEDNPEMINFPMVSLIENVQEENLTHETNEDNEFDDRRRLVDETISPSTSGSHLETVMDEDRELSGENNLEMILYLMVSPIEYVQEENLNDNTNEDNESDDRRRLFDQTISFLTSGSHLETMMDENRELSDEDNPEMTYSLMVSPIETVQEENLSDKINEDNETGDRRLLYQTAGPSTSDGHLETRISVENDEIEQDQFQMLPVEEEVRCENNVNSLNRNTAAVDARLSDLFKIDEMTKQIALLNQDKAPDDLPKDPESNSDDDNEGSSNAQEQ